MRLSKCMEPYPPRKQIISFSYLLVLFLLPHPCCDSHASVNLEGGAEGAVTAESALTGQFLCGDRTRDGVGFGIEPFEVLYAQQVDIGIVGGVRLCEVGSEIGTVSSKDRGELLQCEVVGEPVETQHYPPDMARRHRCHEGCRRAAQSERWSDSRGKGIRTSCSLFILSKN